MPDKERNEETLPTEDNKEKTVYEKAREDAEATIKQLEESNLSKRKRKKRSIGKVKLAIGAVALVCIGLFGYRTAVQETGPIPSYSDKTWEEEQFNTLKPVTSTLMDKSLLEVDTELGEWYDAHIEKEGVHTKTKEEFTYVLVSGGVSEEERLMQLFDVKEGRDEVVIGYNFLNPDDIGVAISDDIPNMIIRIAATDLPIVGRNIEEEEQEVLIPEVEEDVFSEEK